MASLDDSSAMDGGAEYPTGDKVSDRERDRDTSPDASRERIDRSLSPVIQRSSRPSHDRDHSGGRSYERHDSYERPSYDRPSYDRGGGRGGYRPYDRPYRSRGYDRGGYAPRGDRGGYDRGRGGYDRGYSRGYDRGGRGGYDRGDRGYSRGYQSRGDRGYSRGYAPRGERGYSRGYDRGYSRGGYEPRGGGGYRGRGGYDGGSRDYPPRGGGDYRPREYSSSSYPSDRPRHDDRGSSSYSGGGYAGRGGYRPRDDDRGAPPPRRDYPSDRYESRGPPPGPPPSSSSSRYRSRSPVDRYGQEQDSIQESIDKNKNEINNIKNDTIITNNLHCNNERVMSILENETKTKDSIPYINRLKTGIQNNSHKFIKNDELQQNYQNVDTENKYPPYHIMPNVTFEHSTKDIQANLMEQYKINDNEKSKSMTNLSDISSNDTMNRLHKCNRILQNNKSAIFASILVSLARKRLG